MTDWTSACPGTPASMHAECRLTINFPSASCDRVRAEAEARMNAGPTFDPHNGGTYSLLASTDTSVLLGQRLTGSGSATTYTDHFALTFSPTAAGCSVTACSQSQGMSLYDGSTNYCNIHVLYCRGQDGCPSIAEPSFEYTETIDMCSAGSTQQHDPAQCVPNSAGRDLTPLPPPTPSGTNAAAETADDASPPPPLPPSPPPLPPSPPAASPSPSPNHMLPFVLVLIMIVATASAFVIAMIRRRRRADAADRRERAAAQFTTSTKGFDDVFDDAGGDWELNDAAKAAKAEEEATAAAANANAI